MSRLGRAAFWTLLPLAAPQALWVRRRALRLPAAAGPREGAVGSGPMLRLVAVGDSIIAGVGAATADRGLTGRFAEALAAGAGRTVHWRSYGESGETGRDTAARLRALPPDTQARAETLVLISTGVNHVTGLDRSERWLAAVEAVIEAAEARLPGAGLVFLGLPEFDAFPLLPQPLRGLMALRGRHFDRLLARRLSRHPRALHVPVHIPRDAALFCEDGFHPSEEGYGLLGQGMADLARERWPQGAPVASPSQSRGRR